MAIVLFDTPARERFYPFSVTKAIADFRFGIFTIRERWQQLLNEDVLVETAHYLQCLYPLLPHGVHTWIDACVLPDTKLMDALLAMQQGDVLEDETGIVAVKGSGKNMSEVMNLGAMNFTKVEETKRLTYPHEILYWNSYFLASDFATLVQNRTSFQISTTNRLLAEENIFIEEGATVECCVINASLGPVYIAQNANVMEGSLLKGPIAIGSNSVVKMGGRIYGATSIGPNCTVGGEIKNVVMQGNSNKAHDGYLGDAVIGEWCNVGAGTCNSNVKNSGGNIMLWNSFDSRFINVGNKCGVLMGDYTKVAINCSINTGSVYGICCNVFGEGLLPKRLRNFSWGVKGEGYAIEKALAHIQNWKRFKAEDLSAEEVSVLTYIFERLNEENRPLR